MQGIYKIEAPSGNFYIGSSVDIERRFTQHKRELKQGKHINRALQGAANKYGVDSLSFECLACSIDESAIRELEQYFIDTLKPVYNFSLNAHSMVFCEEVIKKRIKATSKPIVRLSDGFVFSSGYEAARHYGIKSPDNLSTAIKNGWKFAGEFWAFVGDQVTYEQLNNEWNKRDDQRKSHAKQAITSARSKAVMFVNTGVIYSSCRAADISTGQNKGSASFAAVNKAKVNGLFWRFVDEAVTLEEAQAAYNEKLHRAVSTRALAVSKRQVKKVRCIETGEIYQSVGSATQAKCISKDAVRLSILKGKPVKGFSWEYLNV